MKYQRIKGNKHNDDKIIDNIVSNYVRNFYYENHSGHMVPYSLLSAMQKRDVDLDILNKLDGMFPDLRYDQCKYFVLQQRVRVHLKKEIAAEKQAKKFADRVAQDPQEVTYISLY